MIKTAVVALPLASLFASLLSGCVFGTSSCAGFKSEQKTMTIELTPEEYAEWQAGGQTTDPTSGGAGSSGGGTEGSGGSGSSGGSSSGGSSSGGSSSGGGSSGGGSSGGGTPLSDEEICTMVCAQQVFSLDSCSIGEPTPEGMIPVECMYHTICEGRRHACVVSRGDLGAGAGAFLARGAHDEAASVHAFAALARELAGHGAPAELLAQIEAARRDEERHAEVVGGLARARGAEPRSPSVVEPAARDLLAIAVENAVEGCVGETWAALVAAHQARYAGEAEIREAYAEIAADEARHAELAWSIDAWLMEQLSVGERAMVAAARAAAVRRLCAAAEVAAEDDAGARLLGVPSQGRAGDLLAGLDAELWSRAA